MPELNFQALPINPDEGFPHAFRLNFNERNYQILLYVNVAESVLTKTDQMLELPFEGAFLVLRVARESSQGAKVIFRRKLVPNLEYAAAELAFVFTQMRVARQNLNGVGAFGSEVEGGVAARWA